VSPAPTLTTVSNPRKWGFGVALGDRLFRLAVGPGRTIQIDTAPGEAPRLNTASSPEEMGETEPVFARSRFSGGEGLFRAHVEGAAADRFWDSKNVSVAPAEPGEFPEVRLLHSTASIETSAVTGLYTAYDRTDGALYMVEGAVLRRTADPTVASPTFADDDPTAVDAATDVTDVAVLGDEVYAATDHGIHKKTSGTWAHWGDEPASADYVRIWAVKGRIVASNGVSLYEVTASGAAPSALKTLAPGEGWTDVADGGSHILAGASDGYVYAFTTESGSMALDAQTLFETESVTAIASTQGAVAVGVSASNVGRLYVGELADNGQVKPTRLIRQWGESGTAIDQAPRRIIGTRDSFVTAVPDGTDTFLWRYNLVTAGLSRDLTIDGSSGVVRGIEVIDGRLFASVDSAGLFRETSTYPSSGYLIGPLGDFLVASKKSWVGGRLETGDVTNGQYVELYYTTDPDALSDPGSSSWTRVVKKISGSGDPGEYALTSVVSRSLAGMVKLAPSSDSASTPTVRSFSFRAYPTTGEEDKIIVLPVDIGDQIERRGRHRVRRRGRGNDEYVALRALDGQPLTMQLFRPEITIRGAVKSIATPVLGLSHRGSPTLVAQVTVIGREVSQSGGSTSSSGPFSTLRTFSELPTFSEVG